MWKPVLLQTRELLNNFFGSVFTREDTTNIPAAKEMEDMEEVVITLNKVKMKIKNLKEASAAGPDNVGPRLLRELGNELAPALVKIFQRGHWSTGRCQRSGKLQM